VTETRLSRREFLKQTQGGVLALPAFAASRSHAAGGARAIETVASRLLAAWGEALLRVQVHTPADRAFLGGLLCPACARIHGRVGDAVYPFLRLARTARDERYVDAARLVFGWTQNVSRDDGSWVNDPFNGWRGTTVFGAIALAEALRYHGDLLPAADRIRMRDRLALAMRFLDGFLTPTVGNVNYRMSAPLVFALAAEALGEARYRQRAREFADIVRGSFLPSGFVFGEGHPNDRVSSRGCRAIDLGYNVEESLPNLAAYAALAGDQELLRLVRGSLSTHLEFLLPDGGWDNSWGTRNYKWTYWGSRTADGAATGLLLAGADDPVFREAALRNLQLLEGCTHDGLLHGGPHLHLAGDRPCLHHTFSHAKMLAAILDHGIPDHEPGVRLPREGAQGVRHFPDIDTWLIARGPWRATVTASDWQYMPEGNASGGALSLLWHERAGLVLCASMTQYQQVEPHNQPLHAGATATLTPGIEATIGGGAYRSLNDHAAQVEARAAADGVVVVSRGVLAGRDGKRPSAPVSFQLEYRFADDAVEIRARVDGSFEAAQLIVPVVSAQGEVSAGGGSERAITRAGGALVRVSGSSPFRADDAGRVFNHVPGLQAVALRLDLRSGEDVLFRIRV
jgi:hypothetical protein